MTNPVIDNIRHSLGRTDQTPVSLRPAIYASRQAGSTDSEIQLFLTRSRSSPASASVSPQRESPMH